MRRILVVDRDAERQARIAAEIDSSSNDLHFANGSGEGLRQFRAVRPDVVLVHASVAKLVHYLKQEAEPFVPVILLVDDPKAIPETAADSVFPTVALAFLDVKLAALDRLRRLAADLEGERERLHALAHTDALCGIPNRRAIEERLRKEARRARRMGVPLGVILLDIDHFKNVNDRFGHLGGDEVLRDVATRLAASIRPADAVGRIGGEEFMVVVTNAEEADVVRVAQRLRLAIREQAISVTDGRLHVTVSAGVAHARRDEPRSSHELFAKADAALYEAKRTGRDRVVASMRTAMLSLSA